MLSIAQGASRLANLLTQLLEIAREAGFDRIGELPLAQPIRAALHAGFEIVLVHAIERAPQLVGSRRLGGRELARRIADLLCQARQVVGHLLPITDHFVDFLGGRIFLRLVGGASGILLSHQFAHVIGLLLLLGRQLLRCLGHRVEASGGVLLLRAAKQVCGLAQAVGGTAGIGRAGVLRGSAAHVIVGLAQALECLLGCLLAAIGGVGAVGRCTARLSAALTRLCAGLSGS